MARDYDGAVCVVHHIIADRTHDGATQFTESPGSHDDVIALLRVGSVTDHLTWLREEDLDKYIEEAKQMSRDLRTNPEFIW